MVCRCKMSNEVHGGHEITQKEEKGPKKSHGVGAVEDVWGDDDLQELDSFTADIRRKHTKQGYLDGIASAKEGSLQRGFDDLYPKGAELGIRIGRIFGILYSKKSDNDELIRCAKRELNIGQVLKRNCFDQDLELLESDHEVIKKWESLTNDMN